MSTRKNLRTGTLAEEGAPTRKHVTIPFNEIYDPGTYYNHDTGWIFRIPEEALALGHSPVMTVLCQDENYVTKISDDPWLPANKARQICSDMDFAVNF